MRINNNMMAMNTHRQLGAANAGAAKSMEKLSSGQRINRAGDDAAGLAISEKMRGQIRGLDRASANAQDGISMIQTAEGALNETHAILQRMRELAVQSSNDTNVGVDRSEIQKEMDELAKEVTRISNNTEFNTQKLTNGGIGENGLGEVKFHVGANEGQDVSLTIKAMDAKSLGVSRDLTTFEGTGAGLVTKATVGDNNGSEVKDSAVITLDYVAPVTGQAATNAKTTGTAMTNTSKDMTTAVSMNINGTTVTLTNTKALSSTFTTAGTAAGAQEIADAFQADIDASTIGADKFQVTVTSDFKLEITNIGTEGKASEVDLSGSHSASATLLGLDTAVSAAKTTGTDAVAAKSAQVTLTNATGTTQSISVDATDTKISVGSGAFKGIKADLSAAVSGLGSGTNTITLKGDTKVAASTTFSGKAKLTDATTAAGIDVSSQSKASAAITTINDAIETVSAERSKLGAMQNRLEHTIKNLDTSSENLQASEARIRDVDMAKEMMEQTKQNILSQAATAMLAQANQQPQGVLQLLR